MRSLMIQTLVLLITIQITLGLKNKNLSLKQICRSLEGSPTNGMISCPAGEGTKTVAGGLCCVKCEPHCPLLEEARVLDVKNPGGGCFGDCLKCSDMEPFPHYKNNTLSKCIQCRDCNLEGKFESSPCTDTSNAQCVDTLNQLHDMKTIATESSLPEKYSKDTAPIENQHIHNHHTAGTKTNSIIVIAVMIAVALSAVTAILILFKRNSERMRSRAGADMRMNDVHSQVELRLTEEHVYESIPLNDIVTVNSNVSRLESSQSHSSDVVKTDTGSETPQSVSSQNNVLNSIDDVKENQDMRSSPSACVSQESSSGQEVSVHYWRAPRPYIN